MGFTRANSSPRKTAVEGATNPGSARLAMGKEKEKKGVSFEGTVSMDTVLAYLDDLRARFEQGEVLVQNGSAEVLLIPDKSVRLSVRAREKDDEQSLRFEIAWDRTAPPRKVDGLRFAAPPGHPPQAVPAKLAGAEPEASPRRPPRKAPSSSKEG